MAINRNFQVRNGISVGVGGTILISSGNSIGIGITNPGVALDVNGSIRESTDGITYWNIVSQQDIGTLPNQIPLNQYLGQMAYLDQPFLRTGTGNSSSGSVVVDASFLDLYSHTASFSTGFTFQVGNLVSGSELKMYVRNTNASQRTITFQGSETDTGFTNINLAPGFGTAGSGSTTSINLAATNGTTLVWVSNIGGGNIVGGILA